MYSACSLGHDELRRVRFLTNGTVVWRLFAGIGWGHAGCFRQLQSLDALATELADTQPFRAQRENSFLI